MSLARTAEPAAPSSGPGVAGRRRGIPGLGGGRGIPLRRSVEIGLFLAPALVLYLTFVLLPIGLAAWYSVYHWSGLGPPTDFIGLNNYLRALKDDVFRGALEHNAILVVLSLLVQFPLTLGLSLLLNRRMRGRGVLRLVLFAPYILSEVITAVTYLLILQPGGALDRALQAIGLGHLVQLWLADQNLVLYTLFGVITWKYLGFGIVLFLAGLQGIPRDLLECASLDGASGWKSVRYITLPLLGPTIRIWAFLSVIGSLQLFDIPWIMTEGGPADASNTMVIYMFDQGFTSFQFGYGSAVAVLLFLISFLFALPYQRYVLRRDVEGALTRRVG